MKKTRPRPKPSAEFEQIPVATVKQIVGATAASTPGQDKPPAEEKFIVALAVKDAKRGDSEMARFPCECPRCGTSAGFPYRVQTDATNPQRVRIELRCRDCHNEWPVERTAPTLTSRDPEAAYGTR